jgi:hypothetical protein
LLNGTEFSLQKSLEELNSFADLSGLNINYTKTQVVWIGSKRFSEEKLCLNWDLTWGKHSFNYLGIYFDVDLSKMIKINFEKKIIEIKSLLKQWSKRQLTPIGGCITVIQTLILPKLVHLFTTLPNPGDKILKQFNDMLFQFVWQGPIEKIKKEVLFKDNTNGGLKMINLTAFINSLKSTWIRRTIHSEKIKHNMESNHVDLELLTTAGDKYY